MFFKKNEKDAISESVFRLASDRQTAVEVNGGKVLGHRHEKLDFYGNPIYTLTYINKKGQTIASHTSTSGVLITELEAKILNPKASKKK